MVSLPIFLVESFFFLLTNADVLMVGFYMEPDDVAVYFATVKTLALVHFVYFAVKAGVAQRYAAFTHGEPEKLAVFARETVSWTFWPSLFMALVVLALGKPMLMLFGPGFDAGYPLLFLLVVGVVARAAVGPCESLLTMTGNQNICALVYALTLAAQHRLERRSDPPLRPVGRGDRHRRRHDLRGARLSPSPSGAGSASSWRYSCPPGRSRRRSDGRRPASRGNERRPVGRHDRRPRRPRRRPYRPRPCRTAGKPSSAAAARHLPGIRRLRPGRGTRLSLRPHHRAQRLLQSALPGAGHAAPGRPRSAAGRHPRRRRIQEPPAAAGAVLGREAGGSARRFDHAHMVEPVRAARHAAGRPRRPRRRDRGFLRDAVAAASEAAQGAGAAGHAARRRRRDHACQRRRDARPAAGDDEPDGAPIPREQARRRRVSEGIARARTTIASFAG